MTSLAGINLPSMQQHAAPNFFAIPVMQSHYFPGQSAGPPQFPHGMPFPQCSIPLGQAQPDFNLMQLSAGAQLAHTTAFPFHRDGASGAAHSTLRNMNDAPTRTPSPPTNADDAAGATCHNTIFPRRKAGEPARLNSKPVVLNDTILRQLFTLPLHEAAVRLGISATAMKSACRKLGIKKWPYRSSHGVKSGGSRGGGAQSGSDTSALTSPSCSSMSINGAMSSFGGDTSSKSNGSSRSSNSSPTQGDTNDDVASGDTDADSYKRHDMDADERDSLTRDAALLAETVLMLQQGGARMRSQEAGKERDSSSTSHASTKRSYGTLHEKKKKAPKYVGEKTEAGDGMATGGGARTAQAKSDDDASSSSSSSSSSSHSSSASYSPARLVAQELPAISAQHLHRDCSSSSASAVEMENSASSGATASVASLLN